MAIKISLIIVISIYEVTSYVHPYAVNPYYTREPRPKEIYVVEPNRYPTGYASPYSYPIPENKPANYLYQKPVEPYPANYKVYQKPAEPNPANYQMYQRPVDTRTANYQVYQKPAEPKPAHYPVYEPLETKPDIQPIVSPEVLQPAPSIKNDKPTSPGFESNVLNNLVIALQLLIINNLMNNPVPDVSGFDTIQNAIKETKESINKPCEPEFHPPDYPGPMPNAKFLGSSSFDDASSLIGFGGHGGPPPSPRVGSLLKSPYDFLSSTSHSSEHSSGSSTSSSNFQSPYEAIFAADNMKDLFSMSNYY